MTALLPVSVAGQTLTGQVTEQGTGRPVHGAFIRLVDEQGVAHGGVLSDSAGEFVMRAPGSGRFSVQAERIGHATTRSEPLELGAGMTVRRTFTVPVQAIRLADIAVLSRSRCRIRPQSGPETQRLWDEARKALDVASWATGAGGYHFEIATFRQLLDRSGRPLKRSQPDTASGFGRKPFVTPTAKELTTRGFIQPESSPNSHFFYAPDADVLLSDDFLSTHCFWVERSSRERYYGLIGLGFEPVKRHDVPDISGVLWLDRGTAELRFLEYAYTKLPWDLADGLATGEVEFRRTPSGAWIIQSWKIRVPRVQEAPGFMASNAGRTRFQLMGFEEAGGEVRSLRPPGARR